ncbi:Fe-S cluster assembly protein SufD [Yunchengibacter salinarum]|uniref:Fe-S cluster assembly protein SufD n=1 Tax=Yunchengibacter salinarum TaxID=3133399 RepID=UPI0035B5720F
MDDALLKSYRDQAFSLLGSLPGVDDLRRQAVERLEKVGLPTPKTEAWKYADLKRLRKSAFSLATPPETDPGELDWLVDEPAARIVFVNGRYSETLSDLKDVWQAISIRPLANHLAAMEGRADTLFQDDDAIALLNTALLRDGMVISVPAGVTIDEPVVIVNLVQNAENAALHQRHLVELGEGSRLTLVERFIGDNSSSWTNTILQARVSERARLDHVRLQEEGPNALHTGKAHVNVGAEGRYHATSLATGGAMTRFEDHVRLLGNGADASVDGAALASDRQIHDALTHIRHTVPDATSDQVFRAIAGQRGKSVFQGKITVDRGAQDTEADQSFKALLLDRTGEADAKPELEIFADAVKCSHGATVGELDQAALFYMVSRGVDPATARTLLVEAFTADALARIANTTLRDSLMGRVSRWMASRDLSAVAAASEEKGAA